MAASLIISNNKEWSNEARDHLIKIGIKCDVAHNGREGQLMAYQFAYEYYFIDLEVKNFSAVEVCKYLRKVRPHGHIFITTENEKVLDEMLVSETSLRKLGIHKIIHQPKTDSLILHIRALGVIKQNPTSDEDISLDKESELSDNEFTRVKIDEIPWNEKASCDYYLRLKSNKYIKVFLCGEIPPADRLEKYSMHGESYLYFKTQERVNFIHGQNLAIKEAVKQNEPAARIVKSIKAAADKYIDEALTSGLQPVMIEEGKAICNNMFAMAKSDVSLKKLLNDFEAFNPEEFSHSFLVCFFSTIICKNLDWVGQKTLDTLALGSMFHDIGILQVPKELQEKPLDKLSKDEFAHFMSHAGLGMKMMESIPGVNAGVIQIIGQHHECVNGSGFPMKLTGGNIYPLAKIVALADAFSYFLKENSQTPKAGIKVFLSSQDNLQKFDQELIRNLIKAI